MFRHVSGISELALFGHTRNTHDVIRLVTDEIFLVYIRDSNATAELSARGKALTYAYARRDAVPPFRALLGTVALSPSLSVVSTSASQQLQFPPSLRFSSTTVPGSRSACLHPGRRRCLRKRADYYDHHYNGPGAAGTIKSRPRLRTRAVARC